MAYINGFYEPKTQVEDKRMQQRARGYQIVQGELYKAGVYNPLLKCLSTTKGVTKGVALLKEIHSGLCGSHISPKALASKATRQGFSGQRQPEMRKK